MAYRAYKSENRPPKKSLPLDGFPLESLMRTWQKLPPAIMDLSISRCYRVNQPKVIFEAFEDETVLINLDSGNYYSFSGSGALIWDRIVRGDSVGSVIENLQERFRGRDGIASAVDDFVRELAEENLIIEDSSRAAKNVKQERIEIGALTQFERPVLQKYSDMQDLLLLDPIHEVDETGWPHALPPERETG
jgi:Coenzyme PQQ synthesis protein D (PqqD)